MGADQGEIGRNGQRQKECSARDLDRLCAFADEGSNASRRQHSAESIARGANAFGECSLRDEVDRDLASDHLALRLGIGTDVRNDEHSHQLGIDQTSDAKSGTRCVVGNDRQAFAILPHQLADQPVRRSDAHEAADHQ